MSAVVSWCGALDRLRSEPSSANLNDAQPAVVRQGLPPKAPLEPQGDSWSITATTSTGSPHVESVQAPVQSFFTDLEFGQNACKPTDVVLVVVEVNCQAQVPVTSRTNDAVLLQRR